MNGLFDIGGFESLNESSKNQYAERDKYFDKYTGKMYKDWKGKDYGEKQKLLFKELFKKDLDSVKLDTIPSKISLMIGNTNFEFKTSVGNEHVDDKKMVTKFEQVPCAVYSYQQNKEKFKELGKKIGKELNDMIQKDWNSDPKYYGGDKPGDDVDENMKRFKFKSGHMYFNGLGHIGLEFSSEIDEEHGVGICILPSLKFYIGSTDVHIFESANNDEPKKGDVSIPVPGGDKETPTAKPYDASSVSIPAKKEITLDQYNDALAMLKKSFHEAVEAVEMIEGCKVVEKSKEKQQEEYAEEAVDNALMEAYDNGPLFEAVGREDKHAVKSIVKSLRGKIADVCKEEGFTFYKPHVIIRCLTSEFNGPAGIQQVWSTRLWQVLGICHAESGNIGKLTAAITSKFSEELGDYKILYVGTFPAIYDLFKTKFGWKNSKKCYFLLVDKKMPAEIKAAVKEINEGINKNNAAAKGSSETPKPEEKKEEPETK